MPTSYPILTSVLRLGLAIRAGACTYTGDTAYHHHSLPRVQGKAGNEGISESDWGNEL